MGPSDTMEFVIVLCVLISFLVTWIITRKWIHKAPEIGLVGFDMNKPGKLLVSVGRDPCYLWVFDWSFICIGLQTFYPAHLDVCTHACCSLRCAHGLNHQDH